MFSLVIPTYNRAPILRRCLANLLTLEGIDQCEIIIANDGSTDDTPAVLEEFKQRSPGCVRVIHLANSGPSRARNAAVELATRERLLFVDDDVFPRPGWLQSHKKMLDAGFTGSQGLLVWHKDIAITPLIEYIDSRGSQFAFDRVGDPNRLDFAFVYTANFAVEREAVRQAGGFDEALFNRRFGFSGFEDTILAYNLQQLGAKLALNREAVADHLHDMTETTWLHREYNVGYAIGNLWDRYPAVVRSLKLDGKDVLPEAQAKILGVVNRLRMLRRLLGFSLSMRLRHREAFYRGFAEFRREAAGKLQPAQS